MSKYEFIKTSNIVSQAKTLTLKYDQDYSGELKTLDVNVYPYTVEEKLHLQNMHKESEKLTKEGNIEEANKKQEAATYESAFMVFKKDDKEVTLEIVKKMPTDWLTKVIYKALEFEGVTEKQIEAQLTKKLQEA